jgi:hypothetical protein
MVQVQLRPRFELWTGAPLPEACSRVSTPQEYTTIRG